MLVLASCSFINRLYGKSETLEQFKSEPELVRILVDSINNPAALSDCYSSIPELQRDYLSYSDFAQYIEALSSMSKANGDIQSFRFLGNEEKTEVFQQLLADSGLTSEQLRSYGEVDVVELAYQDVNKKAYFYINKNADGGAYISSDWVKQIDRLYNYIRLYFDEISSNNIEGVASAIESGYVADGVSISSINSRATAIVEFYQLKARGVKNSYQISSISPFCAKVVIPNVLSNDNESLVDRNVIFTQRAGIIRNNDIIPVDTDITQFILYKPDSRVGLLRIGNNYTSNSVANQLGNPMNRTYSPDVLDTRINSNGETEEKHKIIYNYHGMVLIFEGYFTDINDWMWDGELCAIKMISENDFVLGKGISNGMTLENLLSIYPFLDIFGYRINHFSDNLNYSITFTIDENNVVSNIEAKKD